jgi:hypothetical protein
MGASVTVTGGVVDVGTRATTVWLVVYCHCTAPLTVSKPLAASKCSMPSRFVRTSQRSLNELPAGLVVLVWPAAATPEPTVTTPVSSSSPAPT